MAKKEFVVFGLGRFGKSVAATLAESGCNVLVVDSNQEKIQELADIVTYAVKGDVADVEMLESLGLSNFDGAIVAIGENLEASVMVTILAKEMGIPYVMAKAQNELHAKVLKKVGVDQVVFPEKETGIRVAHNLVMGNFFNAIELSSNFSILELDVPEEWDGHSLKELNIRAKHSLNVIGIKKASEMNINPAPDEKLSKEDVLIVIGDNDSLNRIKEKVK
ncbi:potassium channel family protein [[Clostridium] polysaccharolyticum]|uniref:Trk system potassium uptake protein TrkA n=1 Tax=[Clostridium] polysaccharolyticum TaxID=29364 RepID=A0A1H9Z5V8_9FIRM|nr:TrkA family potassium uptake protein [[Clostridium] polysaccharolyticum]SES76949.1 trk system potassium uptake protein TrkA [[Clostridium] polysaccharolyticum]